MAQNVRKITLESVREWSLDGVKLPVYLGKPGYQSKIHLDSICLKGSSLYKCDHWRRK